MYRTTGVSTFPFTWFPSEFKAVRSSLKDTCEIIRIKEVCILGVWDPSIQLEWLTNTPFTSMVNNKTDQHYLYFEICMSVQPFFAYPYDPQTNKWYYVKRQIYTLFNLDQIPERCEHYNLGVFLGVGGSEIKCKYLSVLSL